MNRRQALRILGLAGVGVAGGMGLAALRDVRQESYFLLTDDPDRDLVLLRRAAGFATGSMRVDLWPVAPAAQDLTVLRRGSVVDPVSGGGISGRLRDVALQLRARKRPATLLLSVSDPKQPSSDAVIISRDGIVWDSLEPGRRYERIEVPVAQGTAVLRLDDRQLSITEAPCRHKLCQKMSMRGAGEIICAPNRLVATVGGHRLLDGIAG